ncbi:hypothetical protein D0Z03_000593 [Geotrichum reessii]|nr:hypothetical protein D0Z03_000593 [Galactomyces reessii]
MLRRLLVQSARQTARPSISFVRPSVARASFVRAYSEAAKEEKSADTEASAEETKELSPLEKELAEVKAKLEKKDKESAQYKDQLLRSIADFRNLQETTKREVTKAKEFALQKFAKDLLESVDNFDRALSVVDADKRADPENHKELVDLYEGIKMTQNVFEKTLEKHGLKKIFPEGEKFDPNHHEATFEAPQPGKEPGTVFFVQQAGFLLNDRVLRAAKVGVVQGDN